MHEDTQNIVHFYAYRSIVAVFRIRIGSRFNQVSGSGSGFETRIWIQGGKNA
jgi:hypothetical protein